MGELLTEQTTGLLAAANGMLYAHNASMTRLKTRVGDDVDKEAKEPVSRLVTAIQELQDVADSHQSLLTGEVQAILARVTAAVPEMQRLAEAFRTLSRLG
jgi:predicted component of type VI protein secretion system